MHSEGVRKECASDDASRAEEREHALQEGARQAEEDAVELARQNTAADMVVADAAAAAKAKRRGLMRPRPRKLLRRRLTSRKRLIDRCFISGAYYSICSTSIY
jgi:hypothetical protein